MPGSCSIRERVLCPSGEACFITEGGLTCQPFTSPSTYPPLSSDAPQWPGNSTNAPTPTQTQASTAVVNSTATAPATATPTPGSGTNPSVPDAWYLSYKYPSIRYTGTLVSGTGTACKTIPIPVKQVELDYVLMHSQQIDVGTDRRDSDIDLFIVAAANLQNRGNCALDHYCKPNNTTGIYREYSIFDPTYFPFKGSLDGTCQPLLPAGSTCYSSASCQNWAGPSNNRTLAHNPSRTRCSLSDDAMHRKDSTQGGTCIPLGEHPQLKSWVFSEGPSSGYTTMQKYLLLSSGIFLMMALLGYLRFKHMARERQRQAALRQHTTYRPPDPADDGLPSYGQHTRDARVTGPAAEEIGMYGFPTDGPADRPQQRPLYDGPAYYAPPTGPPPPPSSGPSHGLYYPPHVTPTSLPPPPLASSGGANITATTATATVQTPSGTVVVDPLTAAALSSAAAAAARDTSEQGVSTATTTAASSPQLSTKKAHPLASDDKDDDEDEEKEGRPESSRSMSTKREPSIVEAPKGGKGGAGGEASSQNTSATVSPMPPEYSPTSSSSALGSVATPPPPSLSSDAARQSAGPPTAP